MSQGWSVIGDSALNLCSESLSDQALASKKPLVVATWGKAPLMYSEDVANTGGLANVGRAVYVCRLEKAEVEFAQVAALKCAFGPPSVHVDWC